MVPNNWWSRHNPCKECLQMHSSIYSQIWTLFERKQQIFWTSSQFRLVFIFIYCLCLHCRYILIHYFFSHNYFWFPLNISMGIQWKSTYHITEFGKKTSNEIHKNNIQSVTFKFEVNPTPGATGFLNKPQAS